MVIERIEIHRFGKLAGFKTDFDPSFNLIEGPNESGKSTLASFIFYMLYGFGDEDGVLTSEAERVLRAPWDGENISGSMTVFDGEEHYLIERSSILNEDGKRDSYTITALGSGEKEEGGQAPGERFFGVPRDVFANTAFFDAPSFGRVDGDKMTEAIENIIFSADEKLSVMRAMLTLKQTKNQIVSSTGKGGALLSLEKERDALEDRLLAARERECDLIEKENLLFQTRVKRKECAKELAKFHRLETDYRNAIIIRDYDRLHELENSASARERAIEEYEAAHRRNGFLPDTSFLAELSVAKAEMDRTITGYEEAVEKLAQTEEAKEPVTPEEDALLARLREAGEESKLLGESRAREKKKKRSLILFIGLGTLTLLLAVLATLLGIFVRMAFALVISVFAVAALVGGVIFWVEFMRERRALYALYEIGSAENKDEFAHSLACAAAAEKKKKDYSAALADAKENHFRAESARDVAENNLQAVFSRWQSDLKVDASYADTVKSISDEASEYIRHARDLNLEKDAAEAEVRALRNQLKGYDEIAVRALVPPAERATLCNHNASDLRHGVEHYEKMLESFTEKEESLCALLAAMPHEEGSAQIAEEMMTLDVRIHELREKASVYSSAEEKLHGGLERLRTEISPRLSVYACGLLDELTDGKYTELKVGDDMTLSVNTESGDRSVAYLSHGTKELTYLALRMALLDLLYSSYPPVCLDDTAAHQDDERAASFMQALRSLAASGKQCFLFTCHKRERRLADSVFSSYHRITLKG